VSVVIATYNWSSVLRQAIASVLDQTLRDFEVLVVGDGCTDDSADVVANFRDPRVLWHNLPRNSGHQSAPNNEGLARSRGEYVAYLGHDDIWHPTHLETLVSALEASGADLVYSVTEVLGPPGSGERRLVGLTPGVHVTRLQAPPSSLLHRTALTREIGGWRDYRELRVLPELDLLQRAWDRGKKIVPVSELTVFKFPSGLRKDSYLERKSEEQTNCRRRLAQEPEFRYRELMDTLKVLAGRHPELVSVVWTPEGVTPGSAVDALRAARGLPLAERLTSPSVPPPPLFEDAATLLSFNRKDDIGPVRFRQALHAGDELPADGLFLGAGWHDFERDGWGLGFRWAPGPAQLVVTRPSGARRALWLDAFPGPGADGRPLLLRVLDGSGVERGRAELTGRQRFEITLRDLAGQGATLTLEPVGGGRRIQTDPRVLDFAVAAFDWA
jgi:hypothetical protein